ncbi:putative phage tail protein [Anaerolentibacter hominis]|uniref:putative phage tail protein n=1 Tax=Anaerolentibacter hominis TaxID=3079009 RepID=UPI0031B811B8
MDRKRIIDYLPDYLKDYRELKCIMEIEQEDAERLDAEMQNRYKDQFVTDLTESGAVKWENMLGITAKGTETIEDRRFRILSRLMEQPPFTITALRTMLELLCGENGFVLSVDKTTLTLTVLVRLYAANTFTSVTEMLNRVVPVNIVKNISLLYNNHGMLVAMTHRQLAAMTHDMIRKKVLNNAGENS